MRPRLNVALAVLIVSATASGQDDLVHQTERAGRIRVAFLLQLASQAPRALPIEIENTSRRPFRYYVTSLGANATVAFLKFALYENNRLVKREPDGLFAVSQKSLRELDPGERRPTFVSLNEIYPRLQPGFYELRAFYNIAEGSYHEFDYGMTPLQFERTISFLQVGKTREVSSPVSWRAEGTMFTDSVEDFPSARDQLAVAVSQKFLGGDEIALPLVFQNCSGAPLRCFYDDDASSEKIKFLKLELYRNYQRIQPSVTNSTADQRTHKVRELEPGEYVVQSANITGSYGELPPGRYLLRAIYDVGQDSEASKEHGITPARFEQTILIFEITRK